LLLPPGFPDLPQLERHQYEALILLRSRVSKRLQALLDKLILKVLVKLIWQAGKKMMD